MLLLSGSLKPGAHLVAGTTHAKVRIMTDSTGSQIKVAGPGMAVTVSGWKELPGAGDEVLEGSEQDVKKAVTNRKRKAEEQAMIIDIDAINTHRRLEREQRECEEPDQHVTTSETEKKPHELRLVIKADVSGSVEALASALKCIGNENARVKIVFSGVGEITESDILLAKTSQSENFLRCLRKISLTELVLQARSLPSRCQYLEALWLPLAHKASLYFRPRLFIKS